MSNSAPNPPLLSDSSDSVDNDQSSHLNTQHGHDISGVRGIRMRHLRQGSGSKHIYQSFIPPRSSSSRVTETHAANRPHHHRARIDGFAGYEPLDPLDPFHGLDFEGPESSQQNPHAQANATGASVANENDHNGSNKSSASFQHPQDSLWLALLAVLSMTLPLTTLLVLLMYLRVWDPQPSFEATPHISRSPWPYLYVDIRNGRLVPVFLIQAILVIAPILNGYIMGLYAPIVVRRLHSVNADIKPCHFGVATAICQASAYQNVKYLFSRVRHRCTRSRRNDTLGSTPRVIKAALRTHWFVIALWLSTLAASTFFTLTTTVQELQRITKLETEPEPGRELSSSCLSGARNNTLRLPCTLNSSDPDTSKRQIEQYRILHRESRSTALEYVSVNTSKLFNLMIAVPTAEAVPQDIDFRTRTVGVGLDCMFITNQCGFHYMSDDYDNPNTYLTVFNCSRAFSGVLGKIPYITPSFSTTASDPDICPLCYKPASGLMFAYFESPSLDNVYNTLGYNATTGHMSRNISIIPDVQLLNPIFFAFAARITLVSMQEHVIDNPDVFFGGHVYAELAMQCTITSFDVEYSRIRGKIVDIDVLAPTNGSILEMFHGVDGYDPTLDSNTSFLNMLDQSSLQATTAEFTAMWERLMSFLVLGRIASVLTPRRALQHQVRYTDHVCVIWVVALGLVSLCCLSYTGIGLGFLFWMRRRSPGERFVAEKIKTPGYLLDATVEAAHPGALLRLEESGPERGSLAIRTLQPPAREATGELV